MATYYAEGIYYATLTDLLSDGWEETQTVEVYADPATRSVSTIADLRKQYRAAAPASFAKAARTVAVANESYAERMPSGAVQYAVALITEDEPGWTARGWSSSLEDAKDSADSFNRVARHTSDEVLEVQVSSMRASRRSR